MPMKNISPLWTKLILSFCLLFALSTSSFVQAQTNYEGFNTGSYIINMGVVPQTQANALKPYGLVYALLKANIPVKWVINPDKTSDGIDFSHNGKNYSGGPFLIPVEFRTAAVDAIITTWKAKGVVVDNVVSFIILPVSRTLRVAPIWTIDNQNDGLVTPYWTNAEIPTSSYNLNAPSLLGACNDIFVLPHADPTWAVHGNLYAWNRDHKGGIWYGCHAGSVFENTFNAANTTQRMNFLMKDGTLPGNAAVPFGSHADGTPPYTKQFPAEPVMQYLGASDAAHQNGSEQIYLPTQGWRPTTKVGVYDPTQANVPTLSPGPAAVVAFGPGRGIETNGKVCAEGGHTLNKGTVGDIPAQRVFWNFSFWAAADKAILVVNPQIPVSMTGNKTYNLSATITGGSGVYTKYEWLAGCTGTFGTPSAASTTFMPNNVLVETPCDITLKVTDNCGRVGFATVSVTIFPQAANLPPVAVDNAAITNRNTPVSFNITNNDYDPDTDGYIVPSTVDLDIFTAGQQTTNTVPGVGTFTINSSGLVTFTPALNYMGPANIGYTVQDDRGGTSNNAVISVVVRTGPKVNCPKDTTLRCISPNTSPDNLGYATATPDNCVGLISISYTDRTITGPCAGKYTIIRTWKGLDECGNDGYCDQTITITDTTGPAITCPANVSISCNSSSNPTATGTATASSDDCSGPATVTYTDATTPGTCANSYTINRTWKASDACGNFKTCVQTITVYDDSAPVWSTSAGNLNRTISCENTAGLTAAQALEPVATDNCSTVSYTKTSGTFAAGSCNGTGTYTNTWVAKDACENTSSIYTQTITITDNVAPIWTTVAGNLNRSISCDDADGLADAQLLEPVATDNCGSVTYTKTSGTFLAGSCNGTGTYTNTWVAKDECLNTSTVYTQVITIFDNTAPTWTTAAGNLDRSVSCENTADLDVAQALDPIATDNCSSVTYTKTSGTFVAGSCNGTGTYTNTWVAKDACLNTSIVYTQVITIFDNTVPTWTTTAGNLDRSVSCENTAGLATAQSLAPVATDNCSAVTYTKTSGIFVAGSCNGTGTYTNTWVAKDEDLNTSMEYTQVITIFDNTVPTCTTIP